MTVPWLRREMSGDLLLTLHVQPGAKRTEVAGPHDAALKIRLAAPPVDGRANACLLDYVAELLEVKRSSVELVSGETSRRKRLRVRGVTQPVVDRLLAGAG